MMKPTDPLPLMDEPILQKLENARHRLTLNRPAGTLPVWVRAALLGAGLTLAAGCAKDPAERPAASGAPSAPGVVEADMTAELASMPPADRPSPPTDDAGARASAPEGSVAKTLEGIMSPGIDFPPGEVAVGRPEATGMLPEGYGVYGAPPTERSVGLDDVVIMGSSPQGLAYGAPPMSASLAGALKMATTPGVPASAPQEIRTVAMIFHRTLRQCLTSADRDTPLADGAVTLRLSFAEGRLKSLQVTGSAAQDPVVKRCIAEANRRTQTLAPAPTSPEAKAFSVPFDMKFNWVR